MPVNRAIAHPTPPPRRHLARRQRQLARRDDSEVRLRPARGKVDRVDVRHQRRTVHRPGYNGSDKTQHAEHNGQVCVTMHDGGAERGQRGLEECQNSYRSIPSHPCLRRADSRCTYFHGATTTLPIYWPKKRFALSVGPCGAERFSFFAFTSHFARSTPLVA